MLVQVRGLGRGKGVEVVKKYSLLDGSDPQLLDLISDRVAVIYELLYEDVESDEAEVEDDDEEEDEVDIESLSDLDKVVLLIDREEKEDEEEEDEEDINDVDEEIIE